MCSKGNLEAIRYKEKGEETPVCSPNTQRPQLLTFCRISHQSFLCIFFIHLRLFCIYDFGPCIRYHYH